MQFVGAPPPDRKVLRLIGSGGMGVVYEALDERLDRRVALKVLHPHLTMQPEMRDRLLKEARLAARVEHENVVRIYNVHEVDTGLCLEMQYIEGVPLAQLMAGQPLSPPHAVDLLHQVLEALVACHGKHVIHADLKPGNLLITQDGKVLLADFGIARAVFSEDGTAPTIDTLSGPMWGTPQYCPPEMWSGAVPNPSWDLYALGVLVHEALCGSLPFEAGTPALLMREKLEGGRTPIVEKQSGLSAEFTGLIDSLTGDDPAERPESAAAALDALRATPEFRASTADTKPLQHHESAVGPSMPLPITRVTTPLAEAGARRRGLWMGLTLGACAVLLIGLAGYATGLIGSAWNGLAPELIPPIAAEGNVGEIHNLTVHSEIALFSYDDGEHGREPWMANYQGEVGIVSDINRGPGSSNPHQFVARHDSSFLFAASTEEEGEEPWFFSASPPKVRILKDIVVGPMSSHPVPVASSDGLFYFLASPHLKRRGMWTSDNHHERTGLLREVNPDAAVLDSYNTRRFVDEAGIFIVWQSFGQHYLMRYAFADGSVENLGPIQPEVGDLAVLGDRIVFSMYDPDAGFELWYTDRGVGEPRLLKDIWPGSESSDPTEFHVWNGAVYFRAETYDEGIELWKTDGTQDGTVMVHDLNPGRYSGAPSNFVAAGDRLFFRAEHAKYGLELWATTGDPGSEPRVFDLWPGVTSATPYSLAVIGKFLCFSANDGIHGEEFWTLDATDPESEPVVHDIREGPAWSEPHNTAPLGDNRGIFIYHMASGYGLMRVVVEGNEVELIPYDPLPLVK